MNINNKMGKTFNNKYQIVTICRQIIYIVSPKDSTTKLAELIYESNKVSEYKQYIEVIAFLYTNNKVAEGEIKKTNPFTTASKRTKYPGINLTQEVKYLSFLCWDFPYLLLVCSDFLFPHDSDMVGSIFLKIHPFRLGCPICWPIIIYSSMIFCISVISVVTSPLSFIILSPLFSW